MIEWQIDSPMPMFGLEGIVSKRRDSPYSSGRSRHWIKSKNPNVPAVKREAEEDWGRWKAYARA
jgi:ATP-dependent DNA ligase